MRRYVSLMGLLLFLSACTAVTRENDQPFLIVVTTEGTNNQVKTAQVEETAVFNVHSETGIGGAQIQLQSGEWRPTMLLRFHLSGLEEMKLTYGDAIIALNVSSLGGNEVRQSVTRDGNTETLTADSPYWLDVAVKAEDGSAGTIPLEKGTIDVTMPPHFYETHQPAFTINWIDFYR